MLTTLLAAFGVEPAERDGEGVAFSVGSVVAGVLIALVAGVGEEIVYRAYAISRLEELGWVRAAIWAPWAVFTVQHVYQGPIAILVIGAVAATFVWLYRWQRSVWPVIARPHRCTTSSCSSCSSSPADLRRSVESLHPFGVTPDVAAAGADR